MPDAAVEEFDQIVAGVEKVEFLIVEQHSRLEPGLLPEDYRLVVATQRDIDVRVGNSSLSHY